jgi:hypothetical protein
MSNCNSTISVIEFVKVLNEWYTKGHLFQE